MLTKKGRHAGFLRGCRPVASCQPAWETPRCWAWMPSVCTTPGGPSTRRSALRTEQQPQETELWSSQDLQDKIKEHFVIKRGKNHLMINSTHYSQSSAHHLAGGGMTRHLVVPSLEWEEGSWWPGKRCFQTSPGQGHYFSQPQPQTQWVCHHLWEQRNHHLITKGLFLLHRWIYVSSNAHLHTLL